MKYFSADQIYTCGPEGVINDGVIVCEDDGTIVDILHSPPINKNCLKVKGIIMPGMINSHCHLELSYLKGQIPTNTGLTGFIEKIQSIRTNYDRQHIAACAQEYDYHMQQEGIVACLDIVNDDFTLEVKKNSRIFYFNLIEVFGLNENYLNQIITKAKKIYDLFRHSQQAVITLHAPYSVSASLLEWYLTTESEFLSIHMQECAEENQWFENGTGRFKDLFDQWKVKQSFTMPTGESSMQSLLRVLPEKIKTRLWVHNTYTKPGDIDRAMKLPVENYWCFCPSANLYIEGILPDVTIFPQDRCVVGTDSLASNNELSIWKEIKLLDKHFPQFGLEHWLKCATITPARMIGKETILGSIEPGKRPGLVNITDPVKESCRPVRLI